jgi:hypothetical protein
MGDHAMWRAIFLGIAPLMSVSLGPSLAQDRNPAPNVSPPVQSQPESKTSKTDLSNNNGQKDRVLERMGPGIDWDHRKPGRDWKMTPGREGSDVKHD